MAAPNLLPNPSAETDTTGWSVTGGTPTLTRANAVTAQHGSWYFNVSRAGTAAVNFDSGFIPVTAGNPYSFGAYGRWIAGLTPESFRLDVRWHDGVAFISTNTGTSTLSNTSTWVQSKRENLLAVAGAVQAVVRVVMLGIVANDAIAYDALQMEAGATLSNHITGAPGTFGDTLTYSLNRVAGTLVNGRPTVPLVAAANTWTGTSGLPLAGALNTKNATTGLPVTKCLNDLAGTSGLPETDAARRIVA